MSRQKRRCVAFLTIQRLLLELQVTLLHIQQKKYVRQTSIFIDVYQGTYHIAKKNFSG